MIIPRTQKPLSVLVVDDTIVYRKTVSEIIEELPGVELAGVAHNGKIALSKIQSLKPDLVTLDIEMPVMNGLELLAELQRLHLAPCVIMLSTLTQEGSDHTLRALELGAFDFILKPQSTSLVEGKKELIKLLRPRIEAYARSRNFRSLVPPRPSSGKTSLRTTPSAAPAPGTAKTFGTTYKGKSEIIAIGISTGGPNALNYLLPKLPGNIGVPVVIVQHMPPVFTKSLATNLNKKCALTVKEGEDREVLKDNIVYIAPGGKQMKIVASADGRNRQIKITEDPPENSCRPSADYLFRSVGDYYVGRTTAVIMTGMGSDGTKGLQVLKNKGSFVIAQDEKSCVVFGMPKAPIEQGLADVIAPLDKIADEILKSLR